MIVEYDLSSVKTLDSFSIASSGEKEAFACGVDMGGIYECGESYYTYRDSAECLFCCILVRGVEKFLIGIIRENFRKVVWCCWMGNIPIAMERKRIVDGNLSGCII